jgi:hypothetical protein
MTSKFCKCPTIYCTGAQKAAPREQHVRNMKNKTYQKMAVIFIDILGTREMKEFNEKLNIHKIFHNEVLLNIERQKNLSHVVYDRKLYSFSDCAYVIYHYKEDIEESRKDDLNLLFIALYNTSLLVLKVLNEGYLVRGGASLGECYFDDLGFFGPSIEDAYKQESECAIYPRVLIESKVGEQLFKWENAKVMDTVALKIFTSPPKLILKHDDEYYLNVLYHIQQVESINIESGNLTLEQIKSNLNQKINSDKSKFKGNAKIIEKLNWFSIFVNNAENLLNKNNVYLAFSAIPNEITSIE